MSKAYILEGTENEYLLVVKTEDEKVIRSIIAALEANKSAVLKDLAYELEKSLHDDVSRRNSGKTRPKDKSKSTVSDKSRSRKTKDS
jgi:hypothetical protein